MRKHNLVKKLMAAVLSAVMVLGGSMSVMAADVSTPATPIDDDPAPQSIGSIIASGSGTVYSSGSITAYLGSGNAFADIKVGSGNNSDYGSLTCSVTFPNGTSYDLGSILASGGSSSAREFTWCPAGTYTFYFYASQNVKHSVWANIYD